MIPNVFPVLAADSAVTGLIGANPTRAYPWGQSPQNPVYPYVVWQVVNGQPQNYLGCRPDIDAITTQVDVYARTGADCIAVAEAVRDALEVDNHMTRFGNMTRDPQTQSYRISMDFDLWTYRISA